MLLSVLVQGSTLGVLGRWLHFPARTGSDPLYSLELFTMEKSDKDLLTVDLPGEAEGPRIMDLRLPPETVVTLISRGAEVVSPMGQTRLRGGDRVTVLVSQDRMGEAERSLLEPFGDGVGAQAREISMKNGLRRGGERPKVGGHFNNRLEKIG